jgi:hypothetical protein
MKLRVAAIAALLALAPAVAPAQTTHAAAAEELFRAGRKLIAEHRYREACEKLAISQRLDPAVGTLLSLGECYTGQGRTASAWLAYRSAVAIAARRTDPRSAAAEERANALEPQLSRLAVHLPDDGVDLRVAIDGESFARDAFREPVPIDPGDHALVVSAAGYRSWSTRVSVGPLAALATVDVPRLAPLPDAAAIERERSRLATRRTIGLVTGGVGLVTIGVGSILGMQAIQKIHEANDFCPQSGACTSSYAVHENDVGHSLATASTVTLPIGVVLLGVGSYVFATARWSHAPELGAEPTPGGARVRIGWAW